MNGSFSAVKYGPEDHDLLNPGKNARDLAVGALCEEFFAAQPGEKPAMRDRAGQDAEQVMALFVERACLFALNGNDPEGFRRDMRIFALMKYEKWDIAEFYRVLHSVLCAAAALKLDAKMLFGSILETSDLKLKEVVEAELEKKESRGKRCLIKTRHGFGFVNRHYAGKEPDKYLLAVLEGARELLNSDKYTGIRVSVQRNLPSFALGIESGSNEERSWKERTVTVASIEAELRSNAEGLSSHQHLVLWFVELKAGADAERLAARFRLSKPASLEARAVLSDKMLCLVTASHALPGGKPAETSGTLARFDAGLEKIMKAKPLQQRRKICRSSRSKCGKGVTKKRKRK
jgi:hypothetical protein